MVFLYFSEVVGTLKVFRVEKAGVKGSGVLRVNSQKARCKMCVFGFLCLMTSWLIVNLAMSERVNADAFKAHSGCIRRFK